MRNRAERTFEAEAPPAPAKTKAPANPVRRATLIVLLLCAALFTYSIIADRLTPYTDQARVQAYVVRMAPDVNGRVEKVNVVDNQIARAGDILFEIDRERYEIAVESAKAQLAAAGLSVGASTAALASAEARLAEAEAKLTNTQEQTARIFEMVKKGVYSKARADQATAGLDAAIADVDRAKADVEQARQNLGPQGADNPQIRQAEAALRTAVRNLVDTTLRAPSDGVVTNLQLAPGQFAAAGQAVLTFIDAEAIWIDCEFRENNLENMKVGDLADIVLDIRPGRIFRGTVESIGWGVNSRDVDPVTGLPTFKENTGWIRDAQRFAVRIQFEPESRPKGIRLGSQANVVVYTGQSSITDAIGRLWIVLIAYLSYLG
ncbi:HlyD family secretion protein [Taklimakanibacter deserti]|uniref:HlyD family secretion protein n=1 Tax=Taklimakanibacter deserti TaxID=2267839 RepID=UPI000E649D18